MPDLTFEKVISVSSENPSYPASNLLRRDGIRKWLCSSDAEGRAEVILQLSESSSITRIDIGNAGSAFVEVQVGNTDTIEDNYTVILSAGSFMTPKDSRNGVNTSLVRIYPREKLQPAALQKKWSRVKVVCTQKFVKNTEFGISFITVAGEGTNFSVFDDKAKKDAVSTSSEKIDIHGKLQLGAFTLKPEDPSAGNQPARIVPKQTGAAVVRNALKPGGLGLGSPSTSTATPSTQTKADKIEEPGTSMPRKRGSEPAGGKDSETPKKLPRRDRLPGEDDDEREKKQKKEEKDKPKPQPRKEPEQRKTEKNDDEEAMEARARFSELMGDVTFVLSGFENPLRSEIRDKAQEMGATYSHNWNKDSTHLISAFKNTPKYKEVMGKGIIVKKEWIEDSYRKKRLLNWESYAWPDLPKNYTKKKNGDVDEDKKKEAEKKEKEQEKEAREKKEKEKVEKRMKEEEREKERNRKDKEERKKVAEKKEQDASSDAEDQSSCVSSSVNGSKNVAAADSKTTDDHDNAYDDETDTEDCEDDDRGKDDTVLVLPNMPLPPLPDDLFKGRRFFLFGKFAPEDRKVLNRYVVSHGGCVESYMGTEVKYVITNSEWTEDFDQALEGNADVVFVRPDWVVKCVDEGKLLPYQKFVVSE